MTINHRPSERSDSFGIVRARRHDMQDIARIVRSSADWYRPFVTKTDMAEHEVDELWGPRNFRVREFFLAVVAKRRVGTLSIQRIGNYAYLGYIYLDVADVGKGYGHRLMNFAAARARARGLSGLALIAHPRATWARKAYERFGFARVATNKSDVLAWQDGGLRPYYEQDFQLYTLPFAHARPLEMNASTRPGRAVAPEGADVVRPRVTATLTRRAIAPREDGVVRPM